MKIVINTCYGGFSLSKEAIEFLGIGLAYRRLSRSDPKLVACVEELGKKADGTYAELKIVEIPDGVDWEIDDYDGIESIKEKHRSWS